ncbi:MAG: uroporphyrinogen-III C-methyltransferase [Endozoicomonadaceae bacterium]|nr:uroporphyrinogen-III C-methyltransferase [Endozoicomonadaceae bacterium]
MSEQNKIDENDKKNVSTASSAVVKSTQRDGNKISKIGLFGCLLGLIATLGVGGLGWKGYRIWQQLPTNDQLIAAVDQALISSQEARQSVSRLQSQLSKTRKQYNELLSRISNLDRKLTRIQNSDRNDWLLAEAEYLLRMANQRLLMMRDIKSARILLSQADQLLITFDESCLFQVRDVLSTEIAALRAIEHFDLEGTWLAINALIGRIDKLPFLPPNEFKSAPSEPLFGARARANTWQEHLQATVVDTWDAFTRQFRIRTDRSEVVTALLSPSEEMYLRQNLRLMLEQAQLALLQGKKRLYQESLRNVVSWLKIWFLHVGQEVTAIQDQIDDLLQVPVLQTLPDISHSVVKLKRCLDRLVAHRSSTIPVVDDSFMEYEYLTAQESSKVVP